MSGRLFTEEWDTWRADRVAELRAPYGLLSLAGTHWIAGETVIPDAPGVWTVEDDRVLVKATRRDGIVVDGKAVDGLAVVRPDTDADPSPISHGDWRLTVIKREDHFAVRVFDPKAETRTNFGRIETFPADPQWLIAATFRPYGGRRYIPVWNADGRQRRLGLAGTVTFAVGSDQFVLKVSETPSGLAATFSDLTSGRSTFRFRNVGLPAPDPDGGTWIDFNRAVLPPCAFTDHFLCPFPPPGNALPVAVEAGERAVLQYRVILERKPA